VQQALAAVTNRLEADAARIAQAVTDEAAQTVQNAYAQFKYWCDIAQERVAQWFALHTRIITVLLAFVFAFALQLDTVEIFQRVAHDRVLRDKLVAQSGAITARAEKVLIDQQDIVDKAYNEWRVQQTPEVQQALSGVVVEPHTTRWSLRRKLAAALGNTPRRETCLRDTTTRSTRPPPRSYRKAALITARSRATLKTPASRCSQPRATAGARDIATAGRCGMSLAFCFPSASSASARRFGTTS
jgi:hypothetical protein